MEGVQAKSASSSLRRIMIMSSSSMPDHVIPGMGKHLDFVCNCLLARFLRVLPLFLRFRNLCCHLFLNGLCGHDRDELLRQSRVLHLLFDSALFIKNHVSFCLRR